MSPRDECAERDDGDKRQRQREAFGKMADGETGRRPEGSRDDPVGGKRRAGGMRQREQTYQRDDGQEDLDPGIHAMDRT